MDAYESLEVYEIDIGNGLPPLELPANSLRDAARQVFDRYSTNVCSIRRKGFAEWSHYDRDTMPWKVVKVTKS